ncbi:hypothetical protein IHE49_01540 [Rhodanobacter sp. 7MK24]|uniref:hypothetical protein n=1 Tax=Rhodanobacter sp. 7MK24 TaxID=2775922 RepID=UPI001784FDB8|nr:hypothetical protein [Rhodanobacter sp. 7MK24]MBD8879159.1 hypothetical protein [Rhodanobacter sp. 7MK24]
MADTIELLEAIGSDASLRYAQVDELKAVLEQTQASVELTEAVVQGDGASLRKELKLQETTQVQQTHAPGHEGDDDGECDPPKPERHPPERSPSQPPANTSH